MNRLRLLSTLAGLALCAGAGAQQPAPQAAPAPRAQAAQPAQPAMEQLTPEQRAALAKQDADMARAAQQVLQLVDGNRIGEVWDGASAAMKGVVSRDEFIKQVTIDRNRLGTVASRAQPSVTRSLFTAGQQVPQGLYINVRSDTRFARQAAPVRELVSFRLDEDKVWRVSGYSLR
jgi:glucose/arabinose dehydrogenase